MALPADFNKIYGSTATGGLTPISDVNYAKGWEFVGSNPPTKNDFSYLQNLSDLKSQWLYSNKLQRTNPFGDIKADGAAAVKKALENLGLGDASGYVGRLLNTRVFTSSGTYTPTPGTKRIRVTITGGGGGGGGCQASSTSDTFSGAGGGAGGTVIAWITSPASSYSVTIGAGGAGGVGANGGSAGGNSVFGSLTAGGGGGAAKISVTNTPGGAGGTATGGLINIRGGDGNDGQTGTYFVTGNGGSSFWGGGGRAGAGPGVVGKAPGSGGGGAYDTAFSGTSYTGGAGAAGIVMIEEFA